MAEQGVAEQYAPPTVESLGTLEELTLIIPKVNTNAPDAYGYVITS